MPLDVSILTNAFSYIRNHPSLSQDAQEAYLANAYKDFVKSADVIYDAGLVAPSGGGPVTGPPTSVAQLE